MQKFGILGCGPSGLLAAHAVARAGFVPLIFSVKQPSRQYGAQWLHSSIPGITPDLPEGEVTYLLNGTKAAYSTKVYGASQAESSFGEFEGDGETQEIWDLRKAYKKLWDLYEPHIFNAYITPRFLGSLIEDGVADYWITSMPLRNICMAVGIHEFHSAPVWVAPRLPAGLNPEPMEGMDFVLYNGYDDGDYYRASRVFGHSTSEYPFRFGSNPPDVPGLWLVDKPISTTCTCWLAIERLGRFGQWQKGVLTSHVYQQAVEYVFEKTGVMNDG